MRYQAKGLSSLFFLIILRPPVSTRTDTLFPYTTLFRTSACPGLVEGPFFRLPREAGRPPSTDLSVAQDRLRQAQGERKRGTRSFAYSFHVTFAVSSMPSFAAVPPASSSTAETSPPLTTGSSDSGMVFSAMRSMLPSARTKIMSSGISVFFIQKLPSSEERRVGNVGGRTCRTRWS